MKVTVYSTPECSWCKKVKSFLKENKIKFTNLDVSSSTKTAEKMIKLSGQQAVPVIDVDGKFVVGFDEEKLKSLLKIK